jgi:outer membrane immunogenic protein
MKKFATLLAGVAFSGSALAAAALAFTGPAHAADMPAVKAAPPPAPTWEGYYIGFNGGGVWGITTTDIAVFNGPGLGYFNVPNIPGVQAGARNSFNNSGSIFGGQIGMLWQKGQGVAGVEVAFDAMKLKGSTATTNVYPAFAPATFTFNESVGADWLLTFMMRAGFDWGAWFPYVTAGAAIASLKYNNTFFDPVFCLNCPVGGAFKKVVPGIAGGGGLEWRWDNHWSLRGEYLHIVFADEVTGTTVPVSANPLASFATLNHKASFEEDIVRGFISYRW